MHSSLLPVFFSLLLGVFAVTRFETCRESPVLRSTPFCDSSLGHDKRVADLVSRLTVEEKWWLVDTGTWETGIPRLHLSPFNFWQEALHGLASCNFTTWKVTSFPQVIGLSQTFDIPLISKMATAISDEARALQNILAIDLSFWAPNLNLFRDPRWGRGSETPGEDPFLASQYAVAFIRGVQEGHDPRYLKAISGMKHYTCYDLEKWEGVKRYQFDAIVSELDLEESFQVSFKAGVTKAGVAQVMASYNAVNGVPMCANDKLVNGVLREDWGFDGHVVSDCGGVKDILTGHFYALSPEQAVADAFTGGVDLDCGSYYTEWGMFSMEIAKLMSEAQLDLAVSRLILNRMRLGEFDDWEDQPYRKIPTSVISSKSHQQLSYQLAQESIVLLKNVNLTLPLDPEVFSTIAVIGPNANATAMLQGGYSGPPPFIISPVEGIKAYAKEVIFEIGCAMDSKSTAGFAAARSAASRSDAVIMVMGLDGTTEGEGNDRDVLTFPGVQEDLIKQIVADVGGRKPVVLVLVNGGPIDVTWEKENPGVTAILAAGYPSQSGGRAIADIIFGRIAPSGRMSTTIYPADYVNQVSFFDMTFRPSAKSPGRGYRFYTGTPVYAFGDGLSYTTWKYAWYDDSEEFFKYQPQLMEEQHFAVNVTNTGTKWTADDVVLAFITNKNSPQAPKRQLFAFERLHRVAPGETRHVLFSLRDEAFELVGANGKRRILPGEYVISVGELQKTVCVD